MRLSADGDEVETVMSSGARPNFSALLIRDKGLYVWGKTWPEALKRYVESSA